MIGRTTQLFVLFLSASLPLSFGYGSESSPRIWIFNGLPGDEEHHQFFEKNLGTIRKALLGRFRIPPAHLRIFYGPKEAGYDGVATREQVFAELEQAVAEGKKSEGAPVWLIFHGHANRIPGGANLNLPGPDVTSSELRHALRDFPETTPLVIVAATASASDFLRALSSPGRIILSATVQKDPISETEFPVALSAALADSETDIDKDGSVTALELFRACQQRVLEIYESGGYMVREHAQLDGNGDGKGTQRPAEEDAEPASRVALSIPKPTKFD